MNYFFKIKNIIVLIDSKYHIYIYDYQTMIIYLKGEENWSIEKNYSPHWKHLFQIFNINNKVEFKIDRNIYEELLKMNSLRKDQINHCGNVRQVFYQWGLYDIIGEQLI